MKRTNSSDFIYQIVALILAVIVVHTIYIAMIRPNANAILQEQLDRQAAGENYVVQRSFYIVLKDYEQEACFILMLWAMAIMGYKARQLMHEKSMLGKRLIDIPDNAIILPSDAQSLVRPLQSLRRDLQETLLARTLLKGLQRFGATGKISDGAEAVKETCETESERLDSELAMIRYIAWAIPSIGFIGTVRGIGEALGQAHKAVEGDIAGVTVSLGVAFNSTFIALVISIFIMFLTHQLQLHQERLVVHTHDYCDDKLLRKLKTDRSPENVSNV